MLDNIRVVLSHPSHPGNIGAVARAMKTMGLSRLCLLNPKTFPNVEATARASGADDVLENAVVCSTLQEALFGCHHVLGASARARALSWPVLTAKACAQKICDWGSESNVALLFGNEQSGLSNEELQMCQYHVIIPTSPTYSSLNLAFSVQILAYEIFQLTQDAEDQTLRKKKVSDNTDNTIVSADLQNPIQSQDYILLFERLEKLLMAIEYLDPKQPKALMARIKRLFFRSQLSQEEFHILMGVLKTILRKVGAL